MKARTRTVHFSAIKSCVALAGTVTLLVASMLLCAAQAQQVAAEADNTRLWRELLRRPAGLAEVEHPQPGSQTALRAALGRRLFSDTRLSGAADHSCASCHNQSRAFTDGRKLGLARGGGTLAHNTPTLWNVGFAQRLTWAGSVKTLEDHASRPIQRPDELAGSLALSVRRLSADPDMALRFAAAFPGYPPGTAIRDETLLAALAAYQRTLISPRTRFDDWVNGREAALSADERAGFDLFVGRGRCATCHAGWRFTDDAVHDIGLPLRAPEARTAFKTPTLRELVRTAPYMHNGSLPTLDAVVRHYAGHVQRRSSLAPNINANFKATEREIAQLVAFLKTLSSDASKP